jgi:hypothetical protein
MTLPASPDSPEGLSSSGVLISPGYNARKTMTVVVQATMAQGTRRHRGEGAWPSGNQSSRSMNAARAGQGLQLPTHAMTARPGSETPPSEPRKP